MRIGLMCPEINGHLNPMTTLGRELKRRGHEVTLFASRDAERKADAAGLEFVAIGEKTRPLGSTAQNMEHLGTLSGQEALTYTIEVLNLYNETILQDAPRLLAESEIEGLVVDQIYPACATVAQLLDLPFVTVCNALHLNPDPAIPSVLTFLNYDPSPEGRARNMQVYARIDQMRAPILNMIDGYRATWNLPPVDGFYGRNSMLAQITQTPAAFDLPYEDLPDVFHYTGPFHDSQSGDAVAFPFEKLSGKPLIYASMGTLQNRLQHVFQTIASACQDVDAQLVISLGCKGRSIPEYPGNPIVVSYAPQLELLKRASVVITHAGLNTALESLSNGAPMVAIPITNDQFGVATRIAYHGVGEAVSINDLSAELLRDIIVRVLTQSSYRSKAIAMQQEILRSPGVKYAAEVTQQALTTRQPVLRQR